MEIHADESAAGEALEAIVQVKRRQGLSRFVGATQRQEDNCVPCRRLPCHKEPGTRPGSCLGDGRHEHQHVYGSTPKLVSPFLSGMREACAYTLLPRRAKYQTAAMTMMTSTIIHQ